MGKRVGLTWTHILIKNREHFNYLIYQKSINIPT